MDLGQWADTEHFDELCDYFDLDGRYSSGQLRKKQIAYHEIPEQCELVLTMPDGNTKRRMCAISVPGLIESVDREFNSNSEDNQIASLAELRAFGATEIELHAVFTLKGF